MIRKLGREGRALRGWRTSRGEELFVTSSASGKTLDCRTQHVLFVLLDTRSHRSSLVAGVKKMREEDILLHQNIIECILYVD